jgi:hypothetical protein
MHLEISARTVQILLGECNAKNPGLGRIQFETACEKHKGISRPQAGVIACAIRSDIFVNDARGDPEGAEFDTREAAGAGPWTSQRRRPYPFKRAPKLETQGPDFAATRRHRHH